MTAQSCTCSDFQLTLARAVNSPNPHSPKCPEAPQHARTDNAPIALNDDATLIRRALGN